jgi:hypothetical protein
MSLDLKGKQDSEPKRVPFTGRGRHPKWGLRVMPARLRSWKRAAQEEGISTSEWVRIACEYYKRRD